ncbi:MAG: hypothetical protein GX657_16840, partial [Chloroflexi bacterium]|nr:hypothetical protein [Chloroflexota bacterium]
MAVESQSAKLYRKEPIRRRFFGLKAARPRAEPGTVVVLTGGQAPIVLWPGQKSTPGEAAWNKYDTMYTIDTGRREFAMNDVLVPAKGGDVHFRVHFSASYRISDPVLIIEEDIVDARPILMRVLTESISRITEKFDIEEVEEARNAVRDMLDKGK